MFRFNVYDRDAFSNDYMGHFEIPVVEMKKSFKKWFVGGEGKEGRGKGEGGRGKGEGGRGKRRGRGKGEGERGRRCGLVFFFFFSVLFIFCLLQRYPLQPKPGKKSKDTSGAVLVRCVSQSDGVDTAKLHTEATQKILSGS